MKAKILTARMHLGGKVFGLQKDAGGLQNELVSALNDWIRFRPGSHGLFGSLIPAARFHLMEEPSF